MTRWKILLLMLLLVIPACSSKSVHHATADPDYDNQYCYAPVVLQLPC